MTSSTNGMATDENLARDNEGHPVSSGRRKRSKTMTSKSGLSVMVFLAALLIATAFVVATIKPPPITGKNAAAILALVTAGAFAIERLIELCWIAVGSTLGNWWPLKPIGDRLDAFVEGLNEPLDDFYAKAKAHVDATNDASAELSDWFQTDKDYFASLKNHVEDLKRLEPGNPRARQIANAASQAVVGLQRHYPDLEDAARKANKALAGVDKFVQTFEDNPARRLMSLYVGAMLGLFLAAILGLDAIQAVFKGQPTTEWAKDLYVMFEGIGVAVTGLVMGAGATPTHELIKALKASKESNKRTAHTP